MSIRQLRNSVLVGASVAVLAVGGLFAGRLSAGAFPRGLHADFAPRAFGRIARALELSEEQKAQVKSVLRAHASEIEAEMKRALTARRALHDAVIAQPIDEAAIRARAEEVGRSQADGAVLLARIRSEVDPILTPAQRDKIRSFQDRMRHRADSAAKSLEAFLKSDS